MCKRPDIMIKHRMRCFILSSFTLLLFAGCRLPQERNNKPVSFYRVRQLTFDQQNHYLSPYGAFSPDNQWLVYDTRTSESAMGSNSSIQKVHIESGSIRTIYQTSNQNQYGPGCGTPTYHPQQNKIIFIHGINNADEAHRYDFHRRTCVMVDESQPGKSFYLDARDVTFPFTPGALRGGTHAHQFSGDGRWIGFTYNDALMVDLEKQTGLPVNLRTVGVMTGLCPVNVDQDAEGENNDGLWFSVLAARTVPFPAPGSDEISRAFDNAWVGKNGYLKSDGSRQKAQAYFGKLKTKKGLDLTEVFISDIPDKIDIPSPMGPLEGTHDDFPMPPKGIVQKRLTFTENRKYPGVATEPRHWLLSSSDGKYIAYLAKDDRGIVQIFVVSPLGLQPVQITHNNTSVQGPFAWKPDSHILCYICANKLCLGGLINGKVMKSYSITESFETVPIYPCWSNDGAFIAFNRDLHEKDASYRQIFIIDRKTK